MGGSPPLKVNAQGSEQDRVESELPGAQVWKINGLINRTHY